MREWLNYIKKYAEIDGNPSSKRIISILASIALIVYAFIWPSFEANNSILILALGAMGSSTAEKVVNRNKINKE